MPLDPTVIDEWARLRALSKSNGWNVGDNDLWIAATASARELRAIAWKAIVTPRER